MIEISIDDDTTEYDAILEGWEMSNFYKQDSSFKAFADWLDSLNVKYDNLGETIYFDSEKKLLAFKLKYC